MNARNNIMKNNLITFVIILFCINSYGQKTIGIKLNGGISRVSVTEKNGKSFEHMIYSQLSYNGGIYFTKVLSNRFMLGPEIIYTKINGKDNFTYLKVPQNMNPNGQNYSNTVCRRFSYLGLPVYIGYNYKQVNLNIGVQPNIRLDGYVQEIGRIISTNDTVSWNKKFTNLSGIDRIDLGIRTGFILDIVRNFGIEGNYYFSLNNNIKSDITSNWRMKNRQITIGIRNKLHNVNRRTKDKK